MQDSVGLIVCPLFKQLLYCRAVALLWPTSVSRIHHKTFLVWFNFKKLRPWCSTYFSTFQTFFVCSAFQLHRAQFFKIIICSIFTLTYNGFVLNTFFFFTGNICQIHSICQQLSYSIISAYIWWLVLKGNFENWCGMERTHCNSD